MTTCHKYTVATLLALVALSGCGSGGSSSGPSTAPTRASVLNAQPVGRTPSESARMICSPEARRELTTSLGVAPSSVTTPTWVDHRYQCTYEYPTGPMILSVNEFRDAAATTRYYEHLAARVGRRPEPPDLGQAAFISTDGSVIVVRKDFKVLVVDLSRTEAESGQPPQPRLLVGRAVAQTLMDCWTGA